MVLALFGSLVIRYGLVLVPLTFIGLVVSGIGIAILVLVAYRAFNPNINCNGVSEHWIF